MSPKAALRARLRAERRAMPRERRDGADQALVEALTLLVRRASARSVAAFVPLDGEPGGDLLIPALAGTTHRLLLPVLLPDMDLDWAAYDGRLAPATRRLLEPVGPRLGREAVGAVDLVVVPALAVDRRGFRLGQGGGSYDRVLVRVDAPTIAPLYPGEFLDVLPAEPHDRPIDGVLEAYEPAHLHWTNATAMPHHWHSNYPSANDGG